MSKGISVQQLHQLLETEQDLSVLDVRTSEEWKEFRIDDSRLELIPLQELIIDPTQVQKNAETYVICNSGSRSAMAQMLLSTRGVTVTDVTGGIQAWRKAGYPITSDHI